MKRKDVMKCKGFNGMFFDLKGTKFQQVVGGQEIDFFFITSAATKFGNRLVDVSAFKCGRIVCQTNCGRGQQPIDMARQAIVDLVARVGVDRFLVIINSAEVIN